MKKSIRTKLFPGAGLILVYGLTVVVFSMTLDSSSLLWIFGSVTLGRIVSALLNAREGVDAMMAHSAIGMVIYIFMVMTTVLVHIPE